MRFNFDLYDSNAERSRSLTPKEEFDWLPLQNHPVFISTAAVSSPSVTAPRNLLAWDGASRLYFWNSSHRCLHRITIRLGEPDPTSVSAASPSKVLQADAKLNFEVHKISINKSGSALCLSGPDGVYVMYLYGHSSIDDNTIICRTGVIGPKIYYGGGNVLRVLQVSWHPYSDTHLGVISSDSVFRLFDLSSDLVQPEQEYYLQPVEPRGSRNATSICPVDFSFGGDHLWDRFTVFVLFSDGSIFILCPIVPFGSFYKWESIFEIHSDAQTFGLKSSNSKAVSNSNMAISWLEATFPQLGYQPTEGGDISMLRAHPHVIFDSSLSLQGPLRKAHHSKDEGDSGFRGAECEGGAVSFLYNLVSKDSILVTAWSGGQLQIDALADEIQPVWNLGSPPHLRVDSCDNILGIAMICESINGFSSVILDQSLDLTVWMGAPPPLLRLAIVDLALPKRTGSGSLITMSVDPLIPERIYSVHDGGIDSIVLHFLPFTSQIRGKDDTMRNPSVHAVLSTCQGETSPPSPLSGFVSLSDSFGYSWIVAVTASQECIVLEMKTYNYLLPCLANMELNSSSLLDVREKETSDLIISKELLNGPKVVLVPQASPNLRSVSADSIEGRSMLHQYFKLFHENYVEYAHKVQFELKHHGPHLKRIIDDQHARLGEAHQKLLKVNEKQPSLEKRIDHAIQQHNVLEERLQRLRNLPGVHRKPLSKAEREFKSDLDHFTGVELDALHSKIDTLSARLGRFTQSSKSNAANQQRQISRKNTYVQDSQISQLKASLEKLSLLNSENSKKVKLVEAALGTREITRL